MGIARTLSSLALRPLIGWACSTIGIDVGGNGVNTVTDFLLRHFTDTSQRLNTAMQRAHERAWKVIEVSLAGDSLWQRCKSVLAPAEETAFQKLVQTFVAGLPNQDADFRQRCLQELRSARQSQVLAIGTLNPRELAQQVGAFARFHDPQGLLRAEQQACADVAEELRGGGFASLAVVLGVAPAGEPPLLVIAVRYFFRLEMERDRELFQGVVHSQLEGIARGQESGFVALTKVFDDLRDLAIDTHSEVLALKQAVQEFLEHHRVQGREVRLSDSVSLNDEERTWVRQLVKRSRDLPEDVRSQMPGLLNDLGKAQHVVTDFAEAKQEFDAAATMTPEPLAKAEYHHNAYLAALEDMNLDEALSALSAAVALDAGRFEPFPWGKYPPLRIVGAGGFGIAFLCRRPDHGDTVVVKALLTSDLERRIVDVFHEAAVLRELEHPAIVHVHDTGYADPARRSRPYLVMDYFESMSLEEHVANSGPLTPEDCLEVSTLLAKALEAAHVRGVYHRDVKPGNVLVRKDANGWQVRLIDFGLALRQNLIADAPAVSKRGKSLRDRSIAGTLDYAAPEQMGKLPGIQVGPYSDVYGFGRTCYHALLRAADPGDDEKETLPDLWRRLLSACTARRHSSRPADFRAVLDRLQAMRPVQAQPVPSVPPPPTSEVPAEPETPAETNLVLESLPVEPQTPTPTNPLPELTLLAIDVPIHPPMTEQPVTPTPSPQQTPEPLPATEPVAATPSSVLAPTPAAPAPPVARVLHAALCAAGETVVLPPAPAKHSFAQRVRLGELKRLLDAQVKRVDIQGLNQTIEEVLKIKPQERDPLREQVYEGLREQLKHLVEQLKPDAIRELLGVLVEIKPQDREALLEQSCNGLRATLNDAIDKEKTATMLDAVTALLELQPQLQEELARDVYPRIEGVLEKRGAEFDIDKMAQFMNVMLTLKPQERAALNEQAYKGYRKVLEKKLAEADTDKVTQILHAMLALQPQERAALNEQIYKGYEAALEERTKNLDGQKIAALVRAMQTLKPQEEETLKNRVFQQLRDMLQMRITNLETDGVKNTIAALVHAGYDTQENLDNYVWGEVQRNLDGRLERMDHIGAYRTILAALKLKPEDPEALEALDYYQSRHGEMGRLEGHTFTVHGVSFFPDGKRALSGGIEYSVRVWDLETRQVLCSYPQGGGVNAVAVAPDGRSVLSCGDTAMRLWDVQTAKEVQCLQGHTGSVLSVVFAPHRRQALSGGADKTVRLWDLETGREVRQFAGHKYNVFGVAFSPDGHYALSGSFDDTVRLWEVESGKEIRRFAKSMNQIGSVGFSPDGRLVISASKTVNLWETETGKEIRGFAGHEGDVFSVAISPDGCRVLTGGADSSVRLWDLNTGQELHMMIGHLGLVRSVAFSPDGRFALSGAADKTIRLWQLPS